MTVGCFLFGLHFVLLMVVLTVGYLTKAIVYKIARKGEFKISPFSRVNPDVLEPTSRIECIQ